MKSIKYILVGILILVMLVPGYSYLHKNRKGITLTFQAVAAQATAAQLKTAKEIFSLRLKSLELKDFQVVQNSTLAQLTVIIRDDVKPDKIKDVLLAQGRVNFYPAIARKEILLQLAKNPANVCVQHAFESLNIQDTASIRSDFSMGNAGAGDTSAISRCFASVEVKNLLTANCSFLWDRSPDESGRFGLLAINTSHNGINEQSIMEAKPMDGKEASGGISLTFRKADWDAWKMLTHDNMNKVLTIVIDNKVYAAPMVRSEIALGKAVITGNFTGEEIRNLTSIISNGALPLSFVVIPN